MTGKSVKIRSAAKTYCVEVAGNTQVIQDLTTLENTFFVVDDVVYKLHNNLFQGIAKENIYLLRAEETNKTIQTALDICECVMALPAKRNARLVSFGGGITQDITGFAANILYRGIHWIFVPTTLLAACDSCIGGKISLNYRGYKNLLGTFYPPDRIVIDTSLFSTLSRRDLLSGLGEVVKFNLIQDEQTLVNLEKSIQFLLSGDPQTIKRFVLSSLEFKRRFVEQDEFDRGERVKLNFAHTFGHAYEAVSGYKIPHGIAVSMGMVTANYISVKRGLLSQQLAQRMEKVLWAVIEIEKQQEPFDCEAVLSAIRKDKKQTGRQITAVLLSEDYDLHILNDVTVDEVGEALNYITTQLSSRL